MIKKIHLQTIDSTNKYLINHYKNFDSFTFVSADYQECGKGRENRKWYSNSGENLLFSLLIKEENLISKYKSVSLSIAVCILNFLQSYGIQGLSIKWPNDIYVFDKKICGILLEGSIPSYLVVGVGLNVNQIEFVGQYKILPTSIKFEMDKTLNLDDLKNQLYEIIYTQLKKLSLGDKSYIDVANKYNYLKNKIVSINIDGKLKKVKATDIDLDNNLLVEFKNEIIPISSGEIL